MEKTCCWNCNKDYPAAAEQCPHCCATNGNVDFDSAQIEAADKSHIDHDWEDRDDSFSHEFGTENRWHKECQRCGATKELDPSDFYNDDDVI